MRYADRNGNIVQENTSQDKLLKILYTNAVGRIAVRILINPIISKLGGIFLNSGLSKSMIAPFVKNNKISLEDYEEKEYASYNDFFTRQIKKSKRPIDLEDKSLISPCDSKLSIYEITDTKEFFIKNTYYTVNSLLRDSRLADKYRGGYACIFRLTVDDYHRYCYIDSGKKTGNRKIKGVLHTVNPVANDVRPIYKENCREYSVLQSDNFGKVLMMEVGALFVGKIVNYDQSAIVAKGQEKGRFEFGGSTIILLFEKNKVIIDKDIIKNTNTGCETIVKLGEKIGIAY